MTQRPGSGRPPDGLRVLSAVNRRLVMLSISGFGQDGHEAERPAYAPIIGVADPDPGAPLDDKLLARARIIAEWTAGHQDRHALKRDLEAAGLAWAEIRHAGDVLTAPSLAGRGTIVEVTDSDGERRSVVRMPYRFSDAESGPVRGVPETGEHTTDVLREWTGRADLPRVRRVDTSPPYP